MNAKSKTTKAALLTILLSAVFASGCERRSADDQATAEGGAANTSPTDATTTSRADASGSSDTSSSGSSATQSATDPSASSSSATSDPTDASSGSSDSATSSPDTATVGSSDQSSGATGSSDQSSGATAGSSDQSSGASSDTLSKAGAVVEDSVITTKLKAALLADSEIKGTDVSVDTEQGEVTLTGTVQSAAQKDRIEKIAQGIDGVKNVQDKLTVKQ